MSVPREQLLEAMRASHEFPGLYPIVLIARKDDAFDETLRAALEYHQDGAAYVITRRPSTKASYMSYHIDVDVDDAEAALERKEALKALEGVLVML
jgi:putative lipoic acid-binding regulatory protein